MSERTRLLAALGHDLRSPLTALRVEAELVEDPDARDRLITSIEEMQGMVETTLSYAKGISGTEEAKSVELAPFLRDPHFSNPPYYDADALAHFAEERKAGEVNSPCRCS